jgi:hypothetical protein
MDIEGAYTVFVGYGKDYQAMPLDINPFMIILTSEYIFLSLIVR